MALHTNLLGSGNESLTPTQIIDSDLGVFDLSEQLNKVLTKRLFKSEAGELNLISHVKLIAEHAKNRPRDIEYQAKILVDLIEKDLLPEWSIQTRGKISYEIIIYPSDTQYVEGISDERSYGKDPNRASKFIKLMPNRVEIFLDGTLITIDNPSTDFENGDFFMFKLLSTGTNKPNLGEFQQIKIQKWPEPYEINPSVLKMVPNYEPENRITLSSRDLFNKEELTQKELQNEDLMEYPQIITTECFYDPNGKIQGFSVTLPSGEERVANMMGIGFTQPKRGYSIFFQVIDGLIELSPNQQTEKIPLKENNLNAFIENNELVIEFNKALSSRRLEEVNNLVSPCKHRYPINLDYLDIPHKVIEFIDSHLNLFTFDTIKGQEKTPAIEKAVA